MMKKLMFTAAVALVAMPAMASAQLATGSVTATATVAQYAALTGSTDLAFGTLSRTVDNTVDSEDGSVTRTLTYNNNITVSYPSVPASLTGPAGANPLALSLNCSARVGAGAWSTAACSTASFDLDVGAGLTTGTLGFGGTITAVNAAAAMAGNYSGTLTISVVAR